MPPISLSWGGEKWPDAKKRLLRPSVTTALELARLCFTDELGLASDIQRTAHVWCIGNSVEAGGSTDSADSFELYVPHRFLRFPRKIERLQVPLFSHAVHEIAHTLRYENDFPFSLAERAVSEGVSMWCEKIAGERVLTEVEQREILDIAEYEPTRCATPARRGLINALMEDHMFLEAFELCEGQEHPDADAIHSSWFDVPMSASGLPAGYLAGITMVGSLLQAGCEIESIVAMPTHEVASVL